MDIDLTAPECAFRGFVTYERKFLLKVLLPFLAGAVVATIYIIVFVLQTIRRILKKLFTKRTANVAASNQKGQSASIAVVMNVVLTLTYFLYLTVCRAAFDVLNCQDTNPPTGRWFMASNPLEECYVEGGMQNRLMPIAI